MVSGGLKLLRPRLDPASLDLLWVENVGNLVCPAMWDLGEAAKVAILSVTEGDDKPLKYPDMFSAASLMLLNKIDLLPHLDGVAAIDEDRGLPDRHDRQPPGSGKAGQPAQAFGIGRHILALELVLARYDVACKLAGPQLRAQRFLVVLVALIFDGHELLQLRP